LRKVTCSGILVVDLIAAELPRVSPPGGITFTHRDIESHIGGHAANVSADLMRLGMKPGEVGCLGAVGHDPFADFLERTLTGHRVRVTLQRTDKAGTAVDLILVVRGEDRRYHVGVGALSYFDPEFVIEAVRREPPALFYSGGAGLMIKYDQSLAHVLRQVKKLGCLTFVDPVMPYHKSWLYLKKALRWTDIFHCNDVEALSLTEKAGLDAAIEALLASGPKLVLVSRGHKGLIAATPELRLSMGAFRVKTLDPTGAGDAFCAGFIRRVVSKLPAVPKAGGWHGASPCPPEATGTPLLTGEARGRTGTPHDRTRSRLDWSADELTDALLEAEASGAACVTGIGTTTAVCRDKVDELMAAQQAAVQKTIKAETVR